MKNKFLLFTIVACLLLGCEDKTESPISNSSDDGCYVAEWIMTLTNDYGTGTMSATVNFDSNNKPISISIDDTQHTSQISYTYDDNGRLSRINFEEGTDGHHEEIIYLNDRISEISLVFPDDKTYYIKYSYNANGQLIIAETDFSYSQVITYEYDNVSTKNPRSATYKFGIPGGGYTEEYKYDNKRIPINPIKRGLDITSINQLTNNVIERTRKYKSIDYTKIITYTYEYDTNGYPTKMTMVDGDETTVETYKLRCK